MEFTKRDDFTNNIVNCYIDKSNSPLNESEKQEIKDVLEQIKDILPIQECSCGKGCGQIWSLPADTPVLSSDTNSEDMEPVSKEAINLMAKYARIACNYLPRLYNLLEEK